MRYRILGRSGLRVSELCLGAMTFGHQATGWTASADTSRTMYDAYIEAGGNFVDTANIYTKGESEEVVGALIRPHRQKIVLATKYSLVMAPNDPNAFGNHRKNMVQAVEASLKRLGTDYIDLYWLHMWDFLTPVDEVMRGLDDLVRAGKVVHVGISDAPAWIVAQANTMADWRGWAPFIAIQIEYSLAQRTAERDLLPMADTLDLGVTAWSPLASGLLTGKYLTPKQGDDQPRGRVDVAPFHRESERNTRIAQAVQLVARRIGRSPAQVALAWLLGRGAIPIIGASKPEQLADNLGAVGLTLDDEAGATLHEASQIELGFPHDILLNARSFAMGDSYEQIDPHRPRHDGAGYRH